MKAIVQQLTRARPKRPEDLPEWARCCKKYLADKQAYGEIVVDLADRDVQRYCKHCNTPRCRHCGAPRPVPFIGVLDVASQSYVPLEVLELDEGPIEEA